MKTSKSTIGILATVVILLCGTVAVADDRASKQVADFSEANASEKWLSVNDNVMGGVSEGRFRISDDKTLLFSGKISLENQGGFASIRTGSADLGLGGYDTLVARVKGDGRTYYLDLRTSGLFAAASYRAPIETRKDTWQEIRIPLKEFQFSTFGRRIARAAPVRADKIQSVGFTLADKQAGPFRLEVAWIRAEKSALATPAAKQPDSTTGPGDIVQTAVAAGQFKTLVAAVGAAGLVDTLKGEGPLTVFAPSDAAFAKLPAGTVEELLKPENRDKLTAILTYHVVSGRIVLGAQSRATLEGQTLTIKTAGTFEINGAKVTAPDIICSNGVIHIIDTVLMPPVKKLTPAESAIAVIELAVERGVPLFNANQPAACAAVYEVAVESLVKSHEGALGEKDRSALQAALKKMRGEEDPRQQAWTLRRALDVAYESLTQD